MLQGGRDTYSRVTVTHAPGCLRFDGQQSAGDGSSIVKGTLAGGVMSARVEEPLSLPVAHSSLHSATAPTSLSGCSAPHRLSAFSAPW
jgi:hypothetical protein